MTARAGAGRAKPVPESRLQYIKENWLVRHSVARAAASGGDSAYVYEIRHPAGVFVPDPTEKLVGAIRAFSSREPRRQIPGRPANQRPARLMQYLADQPHSLCDVRRLPPRHLSGLSPACTGRRKAATAGRGAADQADTGEQDRFGRCSEHRNERADQCRERRPGHPLPARGGRSELSEAKAPGEGAPPRGRAYQ